MEYKKVEQEQKKNRNPTKNSYKAEYQSKTFKS